MHFPRYLINLILLFPIITLVTLLHEGHHEIAENYKMLTEKVICAHVYSARAPTEVIVFHHWEPDEHFADKCVNGLVSTCSLLSDEGIVSTARSSTDQDSSTRSRIRFISIVTELDFNSRWSFFNGYIIVVHP